MTMWKTRTRSKKIFYNQLLSNHRSLRCVDGWYIWRRGGRISGSHDGGDPGDGGGGDLVCPNHVYNLTGPQLTALGLTVRRPVITLFA